MHIFSRERINKKTGISEKIGIMIDSFYTEQELEFLGLNKFGKHVRISKKASMYSSENIIIGNNVRIDDFCILSGNIVIGNNIHIAAYSALYGGKAGIFIDDFANISSRICIYAISDDYSGETMSNPTIPEKYKNILNAPVHIGKHVIIGTGSTILPGVNLADGTAIGAMSLCNKSTKPWKIYTGIPLIAIKDRSRDLLAMAKEFMDEKNLGN